MFWAVFIVKLNLFWSARILPIISLSENKLTRKQAQQKSPLNKYKPRAYYRIFTVGNLSIEAFVHLQYHSPFYNTRPVKIWVRFPPPLVSRMWCMVIEPTVVKIRSPKKGAFFFFSPFIVKFYVYTPVNCSWQWPTRTLKLLWSLCVFHFPPSV